MLIYVARRLALALVTCVAISVLSFVIIQLPPGDFVDAYIAQLGRRGSSVSAEEAAPCAAVRARPAGPVQYCEMDEPRRAGNFGMAMSGGRPVTEVIGDRLWLTMVVSVAALILTWVLALPIGIYSAVRQYSVGDYVFTCSASSASRCRTSCSR